MSVLLKIAWGMSDLLSSSEDALELGYFLEKGERWNFGITHLQDSPLLSSVAGTTALLLQTAHLYVINLKCPKSHCLAKAIYMAAARNLNAWNILFTAIHFASEQRFPPPPTELHNFLQSKLPKQKPKPLCF